MDAKGEAKATRLACSSITSCNATTSATLSRLLVLDNTASHETSSNHDAGRVTKPGKALKKPTTIKRNARVTDATKQVEIVFAPQDQHALATDIVNVTLKTLTECVKSGIRVTPDRQATPDDKKVLHRPSNRIGQPLGGKSNLSTKSNPREIPPSRNGLSNEDDASAGLVACAECARSAFSWLRAAPRQHPTVKTLPSSQLEQGMLALASKLIAVGLDSYAIKELRILKRRFEASKTVASKDTLANLLRVELEESTTERLTALVTYQSNILKIMLHSASASTIEEAVTYLDPSDLCSPCEIIIRSREGQGDDSKTARQLEVLAHSVMSLSIEADRHPSVPANCGFTLRSFALIIRRKWWSLAKHDPDLARELFVPFAQGLEICMRQSSMSKERQYWLVKDLFSRCLSTYVGSEMTKPARESLDKILQTLSILADGSELTQESNSWLKSLSYSSGCNEGITKTVSTIRAVCNDLEKAYSSGRPVAVGTALRFEDCLHSVDRMTDPERMLVLSEMAVLRKNIFNLLTKKQESSEIARTIHEIEMLCRMAFETLRSVSQSFMPDVKRKDERLKGSSATMETPLTKPVRQFVELVIFASKLCFSTHISFPTVKDALDRCVTLLPVITSSSDTSLYVHVSNMYWLLLQKAASRPEQGEGIDQLLLARGAVEVLSGLSEAEQRSAFLWTKLERLCRMLLEAHSYRDACKQCKRVIALQITSGVARHIYKAFETHSPSSVISEYPEAEALHRLFALHHRAAIKADQKRIYYLVQDVEPLEKAALLELQLPILITSLTKHNQNEQLITDLDTIVNNLFSIYDSSDCRVRRARLARLVLVLSLINVNAVKPVVVQAARQTELGIDDLGNDVGLTHVAQHTKHALELAQTIHANDENNATLNDALSFWEGFKADTGLVDDHMNRVDDVAELLELLNTAVSFFAVHGSDQFHLRSLKTIHSLQTSLSTVGPAEILRVQCELTSLCIKMGYFQEAHQQYESVKTSFKTSTSSLADRMRLHLVHLELCISDGLLDSAYTAFLAFNKIASDPAQPKAERLNLYKGQADAGYLISHVFREKGLHVQSLHYAKEALRLYRSLIASLDHVGKGQKEELDTSDAGVSALVQTFESLMITPRRKQAEKQISSVPVRASMWQFGPGLFKVLVQISDLYAYEGMRPEAEYYVQQAYQFANSLHSHSLHLQLHTLQLRHACLAGSSRPETTDELRKRLLEIEGTTTSLDLLKYHLAEGDLLAKFGDVSSAVTEYDQADAILQRLDDLFSATIASKPATPPNGKTTTKKDAVVPVRKPGKAAITRTVRKTKATNGTQPTAKSSTGLGVTAKVNGVQATDAAMSQIRTMRSEILRQRILALLKEGNRSGLSTLPFAQNDVESPEDRVRSRILSTRLTLARIAGQITTDFTYNALPESTLALPALHSQSQSSDLNGSSSTKIESSPQTANVVQHSEPVRSGRKQTKVVDLGMLLLEARDTITPCLSHSLATRSLSSAYQIGSLSASITFSLSAISTIEIPADLIHPVRLAHSYELPSVEALQRQIEAVALDKQQHSLQDLLLSRERVEGVNCGTSAAKFQREYIDILPSSWTVVSIGMSEDCSEIWLARYQSEQSPFILRLPMARHKANDLDDETTFDFESGRSELRDIIECSDYSCHHAPGSSTKDAKSAWWTEREALDERLKELLVNMENIWLGGFKGILSQHTRQTSLLARFRKSFDIVLDRHLPSRQGSKNRPKILALDSHILNLFIGLGGDNDGEDDVEEHVLDLLYFVVDLLQFNGEPNAYDEVDFDSMTIETMEAMRAYHNADNLIEGTDKHMILILDKRLHSFPWESMPCLQDANVSRVGNMLHLRERVLALRRQQAERHATSTSDNYMVSRTPGTFILNPSGDLKRTQETLSPYLDPLTKASLWISITNHAPSEREFAQALSSSSTVLYFGHGSGNQYIRNRSIRKLDKCAEVVWLMGCSSGTVTENGDFEPVSVPLSYLVAGESPPLAHLLNMTTSADPTSTLPSVPKTPSAKATATNHAADTNTSPGRKGLCMSVLATLWDVTDRDIDRFSIRVGEQWGLFTPNALAVSTNRSRSRTAPTGEAPKTPAPKRGRSDTSKTPARGKTPGRGKVVEERKGMSLVAAVAKSRDACYLRYLNGAAAVVYGVPVYLGD